ncbi:activator of the mannose operon (transcriptional antiterminator) [Breznakia sp. PF5-3]|uniref:BglG family transcription antiterminator n=1 Tax=unclassified Breznakia TaxID=2623764 RepID=UPI002406F5EF|nr:MULTISPECIES: BglG family transcription antiterminator [unclassified Breznakia]MDF9825424.1 activator of the mannose operon (transcriptional antiterminator) [Breznakia sp. PM6-1]MDF9836302.1 activator of the mannose operon (transcriptional antiterminator) [Breznakia sp. PF5-3]MDF9838926.1 activator of the mannose operon (transcriptional antiterminator) [Breznakia sp. PFB2-8]MDF9860952.1 activator of the mannose operon (transcriptional antiterminator) [Breznakia sp. PH5-24]
MKNRTIYIIKTLLNNSETYMPLSFFSNELGVSVRTIQNDMKVVKEAVSTYHLTLDNKRALGFKLDGNSENKEQLRMFLKMSSVDGSSNDFVELRRQKIIQMLLSENKKTSINALADQFYVSRTSIVKDMKQIEEWLANYRIKICKTHDGTYALGSEKNIRRALSDIVKRAIVNENIDFHQLDHQRLSLSTLYRLEALFEKADIIKVEDILHNIEKKMHQTFNDLSYINLITHLLIMVTRSTKVEHVTTVKSNHQEDISKYHMNLAEELLKQLNQAFDLTLGAEELDYIYQHLMCTGIQSGIDQEELEDYINSLDNEGDAFVKSLIESVSDNLHLDLTKDKDLYLNLRAHCIPMIKRIKYGSTQTNLLLEEIREKYAALFGVVLISIQTLDNELSKLISDSEVGYITIHFQSAIERNVESKRAIIVCPEGIGFSRLIYNRIKHYIPLLKIVDIVPFKDVDMYDMTKIDLVLSTAQLDYIEKPVITVSSFADLPDIKRINNYLIKHSNKHPITEAKQYFKEGFVYIDKQFKDKKELLSYCCDKLYEVGYVKAGYKQTVLNREYSMPTEIGRGIAIPHGEKEYVNESVVMLLTLKEPMLWNNTKVDCIFFLCLKFENAKNNKMAINSLFQIIDNEDVIAKIRETKNESSFFELLNTM